MRCFASSLALVMLIGMSTGVSADDLHECTDPDPQVRVAACTRVLSTNPSEFSALVNRAIAYRISGDYVRALADLRQQCAWHPIMGSTLNAEWFWPAWAGTPLRFATST